MLDFFRIPAFRFLVPGSISLDDLGPILFTHAAQVWANVGQALGNALSDDNIGPGLDRVMNRLLIGHAPLTEYPGIGFLPICG